MKTFKIILSLTIFLLACSCSQVFYTDFEKELVVYSNLSSDIPLHSAQWVNIPHPADGFNIITKATFIAQKLGKDTALKVPPPILALQK